jgi:mono/diheme cytochrome c family protein
MNAGRRMRRVIGLSAVAIVLASLAACYPTRRSEPLVGPMPLDKAHLLRGRLLFDRHCYKCHLEGEGGLAPAMNDKPLPKFLMRLQVRVGLGAMPGFTDEQISDAELDDILNYIVALRHHHQKQ